MGGLLTMLACLRYGMQCASVGLATLWCVLPAFVRCWTLFVLLLQPATACDVTLAVHLAAVAVCLQNTCQPHTLAILLLCRWRRCGRSLSGTTATRTAWPASPSSLEVSRSRLAVRLPGLAARAPPAACMARAAGSLHHTCGMHPAGMHNFEVPLQLS